MKKTLLLILLASSSLLLVFAMNKKHSSQESSKENSILVSIPVYGYFVERIAGDTVSVHPLVPAAANPHAFEPSPKEMHQAFGTLGWIRLGEPFENKILGSFKEKNPDFCDLNLGNSLSDCLLCSSHSCCHHHHDVENCDLHYWLSPRLAKKQASAITEYLIGIFPQNKELYEHNLDLFISDLDALDIEISALLSPLKGRSILVSHGAFSYFCQDYELNQVTVETEGKDPQPKEIARTLIHSIQANVKTILTQPQYNNKGAELIAQKLHIPVHQIDPYDADYIHNLKKLALIIAESSDP